jgi:hypothetical protein
MHVTVIYGTHIKKNPFGVKCLAKGNNTTKQERKLDGDIFRCLRDDEFHLIISDIN